MSKKALIITFIDESELSGATNRLQSLVQYIKPTYTIVDILYLYKKHGVYRQVLQSSTTGELSLQTLNAAIHVTIMNFWKSWSVFSLRSKVIAELQIFEYDDIFCHTFRTYNVLPKRLKALVKHVDACDNLITGYWKSARFFLSSQPLLAIVYLWEATRELLCYYFLPRNVKISFITDNDTKYAKYLGRKYTVVPNYELRNEPSKFRLSPNIPDLNCVRLGLIGNFRTKLNRQILENLRSERFEFEYSVTLFGKQTESLRLQVNERLYGPYENLKEINNQFDVGYCASPLQAGIQNKVVDYLIMGKLVLVDQYVAESFFNDENYSILAASPFFVTDRSELPLILSQYRVLRKNHDFFVEKFMAKVKEIYEVGYKNANHRE